MRTVSQAIAHARSQHERPSQSWYMLCLKFVMTCWGASPTGTPDANRGWDRSTMKRRSGAPPKGAPVYWRVGKYGHVALSDGNGYVWSNDIRRRGKIDRVRISEITSRWGARYLGWTADYIGTPLPLTSSNPAPTPPPTPAPDPAPAPAPEPMPDYEGIYALHKPAQLCQVKGTAAVYAITLTGAVHIKNPYHLECLEKSGQVTSAIWQISAAQLAKLLEKE